MPLHRSLFRFHANSRVFPKRAEAYKNYFLNFAVDSRPPRPDAILPAKTQTLARALSPIFVRYSRSKQVVKVALFQAFAKIP